MLSKLKEIAWLHYNQVDIKLASGLFEFIKQANVFFFIDLNKNLGNNSIFITINVFGQKYYIKYDMILYDMTLLYWSLISKSFSKLVLYYFIIFPSFPRFAMLQRGRENSCLVLMLRDCCLMMFGSQKHRDLCSRSHDTQSMNRLRVKAVLCHRGILVTSNAFTSHAHF